MIRNSNKRDQVISIFKQSLSCFSDMRIKDMQMKGHFFMYSGQANCVMNWAKYLPVSHLVNIHGRWIFTQLHDEN